MPIKSADELYAEFKEEVESRDPSLTDWSEGSLNDIMAGVTSRAAAELLVLAIQEFKKTYFATADGPEVTGNVDDLETLAVDHFGEDFARPDAVYAEGTVTFSRANADAGDCVIPAGTIVKTPANANGSSQRFATTAEVTMVGTSISATVEAMASGSAGNVNADTITEIESSLTDSSITVNNASALSGGDEVLDDAEYREFIKALLTTLRGATLSAIEAKAKTVSGVVNATGVETLQTVKEFNEATGEPVGSAFKIARVKLYIADANGTANSTLINNVLAAIESVRAAGVKVEVEAATASELDITVTATLNVSGPNYAGLSTDLQPILDDITEYIQALATGTGLVRATLRTHILDIWGPSGSDDLTDLSIDTPVADVAVSVNTKLIPGEIEAS